MKSPTATTWTLAAVACVILVGAPAHGHHVIGVPHYVTDADYPEPILTLTERVGPWRIGLIHVPGNPDPSQSTEIRFRITNSASGNDLDQPVSVSVRRLRVLGPPMEVDTPYRVMPEQGSYDLRVSYPSTGNYHVTLSFTDGEVQSDMVFPVVVGAPGRPWVTLAIFVIGLGILLVFVRALRMKQARRGVSRR